MAELWWDIVLIGGASGIGKSRAAARLAGEAGAFVVEFDDVVSAVQEITTAAQHPGLHHFDDLAGAEGLSVERELELQIATARALEPAVLGVVRNRLTVDVPAVVEGDYLTRPPPPGPSRRAGRPGGASGQSSCTSRTRPGSPPTTPPASPSAAYRRGGRRSAPGTRGGSRSRPTAMPSRWSPAAPGTRSPHAPTKRFARPGARLRPRSRPEPRPRRSVRAAGCRRRPGRRAPRACSPRPRP